MQSAMYQFSVPLFKNMLTNLKNILITAQNHGQQNRIQEQVYLQSRVFPDMFPLSRQIQIAADLAKSSVARLSGNTAPSFADTETSFDQLLQRLDNTLAFIDTVDAASFSGTESKALAVKWGGKELKFEGLDYLQNFVLPQFYFHVSTAYAILRSNGIALGKDHYTGDFAGNR